MTRDQPPSDIPSEVIGKIVSHLTISDQPDYKSLFSCLLVARNWFGPTAAVLWSMPRLSSESSFNSIITALQSTDRGADYLNAIRELYFDLTPTSEVSNESVTHLMSWLSSQKPPSLSAITIKGDPDLASNIVHLAGKSSYADQITRLEPCVAINAVFLKFPNIQNLTFHEQNDHTLKPSHIKLCVKNIASNLSSLNIFGCEQLDPSSVISLLEASTNLLRLDIGKLTFTSHDYYTAFNDKSRVFLPRLESLSINESNWSLEVLKLFIERIRPTLKHLVAINVRSDQQEGQIAPLPKVLKTLAFDFSKQINDVFESVDITLDHHERVSELIPLTTNDFKTVEKAFQYFSRIHEFVIRPSSTSKTYKHLLDKSGKSLEALTMINSEYSVRVQKKLVQDALRLCSGLKRLSLVGFDVVRAELVSAIGHGKIVELVMDGSDAGDVSVDELREMIRRCPRLKVLKMEGLKDGVLKELRNEFWYLEF